MSARIIVVDPLAPDPALLREAAAVLAAGGLAAFPTETVYGLGALALDPAAVGRIFAAKGRPATNPAIVHVARIEQARELAAEWPEAAARLAARFWPGPLTLVAPKTPVVPDVVTGGGPTVALRIPSHAVALGLLRAVDAPIAAPSANRSEQVSATRAEHVLKSLGERIDLVLDAGPTPGGIESTVVDVSVDPPRLLRPGLVSAAELRRFLGALQEGPAGQDVSTRVPQPSPGMRRRHYAPRASLTLAADERAAERLAAAWAAEGKAVGWLALATGDDGPGVMRLAMPAEAAAYAAALYHVLHELDALAVERIVVTLPPAGAEWQAIHDRLARAAAPASEER